MPSIEAPSCGTTDATIIPSTFARIDALRRLLKDRDVLVCVDGGVKRSNVVEIASSGVDIIVTGSAVFDGKAPLENANFMLDAIRSGQG